MSTLITLHNLIINQKLTTIQSTDKSRKPYYIIGSRYSQELDILELSIIRGSTAKIVELRGSSLHSIRPLIRGGSLELTMKLDEKIVGFKTYLFS